MPEPLKNQFGLEIAHQLAAMLTKSDPSFDTPAFIYAVSQGYDSLELMPRAWHIADALHQFLPNDYSQAAQLIIDSLGDPLKDTDRFGMSVFLYLPYVFFVARYGANQPEHFDLSMRAQYELTQRFSAEFSIRPYLEMYPERTLAQLHVWASDENEHVRRLVSEGSRPRLPWAPRLKMFQTNPQPAIELLEKLKDDPSLYVRRSVANHLNDIGKDHPQLLIEIAQRWLHNASDQRQWIVKHALRSAVKRGDPDALKLLGFGAKTDVTVADQFISASQIREGEGIEFACSIKNNTQQEVALMIDYVIHFVKANQATKHKVFKLTQTQLLANETLRLQKRHSFRKMTTRTHYAGAHHIELQINGVAHRLGSFDLVL